MTWSIYHYGILLDKIKSNKSAIIFNIIYLRCGKDLIDGGGGGKSIEGGGGQRKPANNKSHRRLTKKEAYYKLTGQGGKEPSQNWLTMYATTLCITLQTSHSSKYYQQRQSSQQLTFTGHHTYCFVFCWSNIEHTPTTSCCWQVVVVVWK